MFAKRIYVCAAKTSLITDLLHITRVANISKISIFAVKTPLFAAKSPLFGRQYSKKSYFLYRLRQKQTVSDTFATRVFIYATACYGIYAAHS